MAFNFASSAKTAVQVGSGAELIDEFTDDGFTVGGFTQAGIDMAFKEQAKTPIQGQKYFKVKNVDKNNYTYKGMNGIGLVKLNSDGDAIPTDKKSSGFDTTISNYTMRLQMGITRELLETDRYGVVGDHSRDLTHAARKTIERIYADAFNRGFGTTSLSLLAEDGLALFSASRPQPKAGIAAWSNLETSGALTADAIASARLNFRKYLDRNGDLDPQLLDKTIVSPDLEDTIMEIVDTSLKVDTSLNNTNIVSKENYEVWDWLNSDVVVYCGTCQNELEAHWRKSPSVLTYQDGSNPDLIWSRLRMAMGTGLRRPGKYRGQIVI